MTYRGIEYVKVRGFWRALPGQSTGERSPRARKKKRGARPEPTTFWECVDRHGTTCGVHHHGLTAASRHTTTLDRGERRRGRKATWEPFKVIDGRGYHYGVGAPKH